MQLNTLFYRWLLIYFPSSAPDKVRERLISLLWKKFQKEKPLWYNPVSDQLTKDFGLSLLNLKISAEALAQGLDLSGKTALPPSWMPAVAERLTDQFLEKVQLNREKLSFAAIQHEVSALRGSDYRYMQQMLQSRVKTLPRGDLSQWEASLPALEALAHLVCFDWAPLTALLPAEGKTTKAFGTDFALALEDLVFLLLPVHFDPGLKTLISLLVPGPEAKALESLEAARKILLEGERLLDLIRAIYSSPEKPFRKVTYQPVTLTSLIKEIIADFDAELKRHQAASEQVRLAARMKDVFADRELVAFPAYNEETDGLLLGKKLPGLTYTGAVKVLYNFQESFHAGLFQKFFQSFQLEADFLTEDAKEEFKVHLDDYYQMISLLGAFTENMLSPSYSKLAPVLTVLQATFVETRTKQALKKPIEEANHWADEVCQRSYQTIKRLHHLFEKYLIDLTDPSPHFFSGGQVLQTKHPDLVHGMATGAKVLKGMSGILRQMVVDLAEGQAKLNEKEDQ